MLQAKPNQQNLGIKFEFTAPGTPQQKFSGRRKFPTLLVFLEGSNCFRAEELVNLLRNIDRPSYLLKGFLGVEGVGFLE